MFERVAPVVRFPDTEARIRRYWREARLQRIAPVTQEMTLNYIAQTVLGLPRSY